MHKTTVTVTEYNPAGDIVKMTETVDEYDPVSYETVLFGSTSVIRPVRLRS